jgi:hypothetical protein
VRKIGTEISAASKVIAATSLKSQLQPLNTQVINLQRSMIYLQAAETNQNLDAEGINNVKSMINRGLIFEFDKNSDIEDVDSINILINNGLIPNADPGMLLYRLGIVGDWLHESDHQAVSGKCSSAHFSIGYKIIGFHYEEKFWERRGGIDLTIIDKMLKESEEQAEKLSLMTEKYSLEIQKTELNEGFAKAKESSNKNMNLPGAPSLISPPANKSDLSEIFGKTRFFSKSAVAERYEYFLSQDRVIVMATNNARLVLRHKDPNTLELLRFKWQGKDVYNLPKNYYGAIFKKCS